MLTPGGRPLKIERLKSSQQPPAAALALALARVMLDADPGIMIYLASGEHRAEEIGRALTVMAPGIEAMVLPPWDCLPYDRVSPSSDIMGRRMRALSCLGTRPTRPRVVITSPDAIVQRLPPSSALANPLLPVRCGQLVDRKSILAFAAATGYRLDDRAEEPGEMAASGLVIDVFPADGVKPVRIVLDESDVVTELRTYDPLTQRTDQDIEELVLGPASELILPPSDTEDRPDRPPGGEHRLPDAYDSLQSIFDLVPEAGFSHDPEALPRLQEVEDHIREAFEARKSLGDARDSPPLSPDRLYQGGDEILAGIGRWTALDLNLAAITPIASVAADRNPGRALCALIKRERGLGHRVVLAGSRAETRAMAKTLRRGLDLSPVEITDWHAVASAEAGALLSAEADLETGFLDPAGLVVVAAPDVFGSRLADRDPAKPRLAADPDFRIGDVVIHEDRGVGVLRGLETAEVAGIRRDLLRLEYHGDTSALVPVEEIGLIWRYGAEADAVSLDRLKGDAWQKRRTEVACQIEETARHLVALAKVRAEASCSPIVPPREPFAAFVGRFTYPPTRDQASAIEAVLADLASGQPMDRLVCGDVGFGKTEVALRAAAAVALDGRQVAIVAPTTVLARQHFLTFRRRFAGMGVEIAHLSRLVAPPEAKAIREQLASGAIRILIGTHAVAAKGTIFADLGLMIIDEEQKFGTGVKQRLHGLADGGHLLTMTATPIPRTLQSAMVGIQEISVIATPPARRRPVRTFLMSFDAASVRTAVLREKRRGGQSFFVVPRIEDIEPIALKLAKLAPELVVRIAHGDLPAEQADEAMVGFADGDGDMLLATNIIESGLDVPRANTMFVWRPERFGLTQLHQLRGRVGRGRTQGIAYLLADPEEVMSDATRSRLSTLEAFDRLGAGLDISARDLDLRGGGNLTGEEQAGHIKMIGTALYQRLLARAVATAKGENLEPDWAPALNLEEHGGIPAEYVPEVVTRINLYARLARMDDVVDLDGFEEELVDRFGPVPLAVDNLLTMARLQRLARAADVRKVDAGPKGIALSLGGGAAAGLKRVRSVAPSATMKDGRLIVSGAFEDSVERLRTLERLLSVLGR
jgi:transcription-repair coupling factor (superfamily II helicase)